MKSTRLGLTESTRLGLLEKGGDWDLALSVEYLEKVRRRIAELVYAQTGTARWQWPDRVRGELDRASIGMKLNPTKDEDKEAEAQLVARLGLMLTHPEKENP